MDSDWNLYKKILNFFQVLNHKNETIQKALESCLTDWDIDRVLTIILDNASSNDSAITYLKWMTKD
jgi:hypothetical protein